MILYEQMIAFGYHLLAGQLLGFFYSFLALCCISFSSGLRIAVYTLFSMSCTFFFYFGLYTINGGVTHFYLMVLLFLGVYMYYHFFYELLLPVFFMVKKLLRPVKKKLGFAKKRIYVIIKRTREERRRSKLKNEQRKKKHKSEKV